MSNAKSFSREEVVSIITDLTKFILKDTLGYYNEFSWEEECPLPSNVPENSFFSKVFGQTMSLIESTVEEKKVDSTKTIFRQLIYPLQEKTVKSITEKIENAVKNDLSVGYGALWGDFINKLNS